MKLNKKQKRTATIASMAALLAVVLGMGGQTFAKYIETTGVQAQNAVVAKWGVVAKVSGDGTDGKSAFSKTYDGTVVSTTEVVAPGTTGSLTFTITGQPEVATSINFEMAVTSEISLNGSYYPIQWTLDPTTASGDEVNFNANCDESMSALDGIKDSFNDLSTTKTAGTNLETTVVLSWKWVFNNSHDTEDTQLGDYAQDKSLSESDWLAKYGYAKPTANDALSFTVNLTIEQED